MTSVSMRLRLFVIIMLPLLLISTAVGFWRLSEAQKTAESLYDKNLLFTAVAVARDVALLDGDAILHQTEKLLSDAAGGPVRYHVYAPNGGFVIGYGVPPIPARRASEIELPFTYYDVVHRGDPVRVLRMKDEARIGGQFGIFTITVWQDKAARDAFARSLAWRAVAVIAALIVTVAFVVWFGVNLGLRPLLDLEEAISQRSPKDLSPIRRAVPQEALGLVQRLNHLFARTRDNIAAQDAFISDAAHQLRNPIAGIRALGEAVQSADTLEAAQARAGDLVIAAGKASELAEQLLRLERMRTGGDMDDDCEVDLDDLMRALVAEHDAKAQAAGVALAFARGDLAEGSVLVQSDPVMLHEAFANLIDNALKHGGAAMTKIALTLDVVGEDAVVSISDDGVGIPPEAMPKALARFGQVQPSAGSGLGLPIAEAVATRNGGSLSLGSDGRGLRVTIRLRRQRPAA